MRENEATFNVRSIAIIGAGPGGIAATKYLLAERCFDRIDVFEQRDSVGGVWNYHPDPDRASCPIPQNSPDMRPSRPLHDGSSLIFQTPMYENLETNIPGSLMQFSDLTFPFSCQLFPRRETVLQYLKDYAEEVMHHVLFSTQVLDIQRETSQNRDRWRLTAKDLVSQAKREDIYDAIVVANGHYNIPFVPDILNISKWNESHPGTIQHSSSFRTTEDFKGKKVLVVGNAASGLDIGAHIAQVCRKPLLVSQRSVSYLSPLPELWRKELPEIAEFITENRRVRFIDGTIEDDVDAIVFCTGYFYSFPFFSSLDPPPAPTGIRAEHVYKHIFFTPHPTLAFIGLPQKVVPFPVSECQAAVAARVWANRIRLPERHTMEDWEMERLKAQETPNRFHHFKFPADAAYLNDLHDWCMQADVPEMGKEPPRWGEKMQWIREKFPEIKRAFAERGEERRNIRTMEDLGFNFETWKSNTESESYVGS
ncbi:MAG: hypothetical protein M1825_005921 [Sarcosagium campestre]|nr:MAG: hypothetical protein M1825_005921 [Sarcosagium campestre]